MDGERFDGMVRAAGQTPVGRRAAAAGLAAFVAAVAGGARTEAGNKGRCPKAKRCGKDCCGDGRCFVKKLDASENPIAYGCCPADQICERASGQKQCCYPDERCQPGLETSSPQLGTGNCCRKCGSVCCENDQRCENGACVQIIPPRYVRNRR